MNRPGLRELEKYSWSAPNISLELTGLSWSFAGFGEVAAGVGGRGYRAWAALQLSSDRYIAKKLRKDMIFDKLLSALIGALVAVISIFIKDHLIVKASEKRKNKQSKLITFKLYANPIIRATETLCWRLKEIFEQRGAFLLEGNPRNTFFQYKYISTIYRLSVLIGWIRAVYREFAYIDTSESKGNRLIENAFMEFQKALADGQHLELSILIELASCWKISLKSLSKEEKAKLAVKLENIVYNIIKDSKIILASKLSDEEQVDLLQKLSDTICNEVHCTEIEQKVIKESQNTAIREISRIETWIYRDWQNAIGDVMLVKIENSPRRYDVIGYGEFEELFEKNKWIKKVSKLFDNLNVEIDDRMDARVGQLKRVYKAAVGIMEAFNDSNINQETIPENSLNKLTKFANELDAI
ncbi:MAG: hypothetical protein GF308_18215 [Candidatus Heimdallarchaeota archaeon]|nr:hypothetical protein [Candidatus Heimdallarchaeota archaeon]